MITTIFFVSSDLRILPRTPHHGMLVICDVPDSRIALLRRGFKVLASSDFTCNSFWNDVINSRNKLLKKIPISDILRSSDLSSELDGSLKFHLRFWITKLFYEIKLKSMVYESYRPQSITYGADWILSGQSDGVGHPYKKVSVRFWLLHSFQKIILNTFFCLIRIRLRIFFHSAIVSLNRNNGMPHLIKSFYSAQSQPNVVFLTTGEERKNFWGVPVKLFLSTLFKKRSISLLIHVFGSLQFGLGEKYKNIELSFVPSHKELSQLFGHQSETLKKYKVLEKKLYSFIEDWCRHRVMETMMCEKVFRDICPKAFVSQDAVDLSAVAAIEARKQLVPSILIPHGSYVDRLQTLSNREWLEHASVNFDGPFDFTCIQTDAAAVFHKKNNVKTKPLFTGPLIIRGKQDLKSSLSRANVFGNNFSDTIFLYCSTPKASQALRPLAYETLDEYLRNIITFVTVASSVPGVFVAIRHREIDGLSTKTLQFMLRNHENFGIFDGGDFLDYLPNCDAVVSYSSTVIEQSFFLNKPVLVWNEECVDHLLFNEAVADATDQYCERVRYSTKKTLLKDILYIKGSTKSVYQSGYSDFGDKSELKKIIS